MKKTVNILVLTHNETDISTKLLENWILDMNIGFVHKITNNDHIKLIKGSNVIISHYLNDSYFFEIIKNAENSIIIILTETQQNIITDQNLLNCAISAKNHIIYSIDPRNIFTKDHIMSIEQQCDAFKFPAAVRYYDANIIPDQETLILTHDGGFFSIATIKLEDILVYFNKFKKVPKNIISNRLFGHYRDGGKLSSEDLTHLFFKGPLHTFDHLNIPYTEPVLMHDPTKSNEQFTDYRKLHFDQLRPFLIKYFTRAQRITDLENELINRYNLTNEDFEETCSVMFRGNDKCTETNIASHEDFIMKARSIKERHPDIKKFIVQTDVSEFLNDFLNDPIVGPMSMNFKEVPTISKNGNSTVFFSGPGSKIQNVSYYLASLGLISRTKYFLSSSGNGEMWTVLFRSLIHKDPTEGLYQYLNPKEIICSMKSLAYEGPKDDYFLN